MQISSKEVTQQTSQKIKLIEGSFTVAEAADIVNSVLNIKINFHKLQRLSKTEHNIADTCEYDNDRIYELIADKTKAKAFFKDLRNENKTLRIQSTIQIDVEA